MLSFEFDLLDRRVSSALQLLLRFGGGEPDHGERFLNTFSLLAQIEALYLNTFLFVVLQLHD